MPNATDEQVKDRYRRLAMEFHPDVGGDEENWKLMSQAKDVLLTVQKKIDEGKRQRIERDITVVEHQLRVVDARAAIWGADHPLIPPQYQPLNARLERLRGELAALSG
jgi:curved DNA-binding protein CbpA